MVNVYWHLCIMYVRNALICIICDIVYWCVGTPCTPCTPCTQWIKWRESLKWDLECVNTIESKPPFGSGSLKWKKKKKKRKNFLYQRVSKVSWTSEDDDNIFWYQQWWWCYIVLALYFLYYDRLISSFFSLSFGSIITIRRVIVPMLLESNMKILLPPRKRIPQDD